MTNVLVFMVNISGAQKVFKIPLVLLAFAITLKELIPQESNERTKENQDMILPVHRCCGHTAIFLLHKLSKTSK